jgi:PKD repeat protein
MEDLVGRESRPMTVQGAQMRRTTTTTRIPALLAATLLAIGLLPGLAPAAADSAPEPPETVSTVTADSLPTVQVDGIVWDQLIVGNTVYVVGSFNYARPAGAAPTTGRVARSGALAYDIRTGALIKAWRPRLNGPGRSLAVSSDRTRIYIGGDFTQVNGTARRGLVAVDPSTGALVSAFRANANGRVASMAVSGSTLYFGGNFTQVSGRARQRLAAVRASSGALLAWAPRADLLVTSVVVPRGVGNVVVGGRFETLNGVRARGMGALDAATGQVRRWEANRVLQNYGPNSAITSLSTDGVGTSARVFGTAYTYNGTSRFEGSFRAAAVNGRINWINGCRGDTYDAVPVGTVLYSVGHPHYCKMIGGHPNAPKPEQKFIRAMATTTARDGVNTEDVFKGQPAPRLLHWLPTLNAGTVTGQNQAAWTVAANSDYVVLGGEFTEVNRQPQQGLARFAVRSKAPNKQGPQGYDELKPKVSPAAGGVAVIRWLSGWDRDNRAVTHELLRGATTATATVVATRKVNANWWSRPVLGYTDMGLRPGSSQTYRVRVTDPLGNKLTSAPVTVTLPTTAVASTSYRDTIRADRPLAYWRLGEASGATAYDWQATNDLALSTAVKRGRGGAIALDGDGASAFPGTAGVHAVSRVRQAAPKTFSVEAWVRTTSTKGGKIVGFGNSRTALSTKYDRHIYMDNQGRITFGVHNGSIQRITSGTGFNNGAWHHVVGTLGPQGMTLHVDGKQISRKATVTSAGSYLGYWRLGGDKLGSWPAAGSSLYFSGTIDDVAVYSRALTGTQIADHAARGRNRAPVASFSPTVNELGVSVDASASSDPEKRPLTYAWAFGDGATGSGVTASHTYAAAGTYTVTLTVTDSFGATARTQRSIIAVAPNQPPVATFSATAVGASATVDASGSSDPEGSALTYAWTFGDGATGSGVTASHIYAAAGTYTVTLTVTDAGGRSSTLAQPVTVGANLPPVAEFSATAVGASVTVDASGSSDPEGSALTYAWAFGDGATGSGVTASHTYASAGNHTVTLTVTDSAGGTATLSKKVLVSG